MTRAAVLLVLCLPAAAAAHDLTSEAGLGATLFLGSAADNAAPGPAFEARVGWGPTRWLTLGGLVAASTHEATVPPPPSGELFQLYQLGLDLRFAVRAGRVGLFLEGSGGVVFVSTNVLDEVGITEPDRHWGSFLLGGGGIMLHTRNPRFAFGIAGDYVVFPDLDFTQSVTTRVFLRYTR
jgi:hypothetical protein